MEIGAVLEQPPVSPSCRGGSRPPLRCICASDKHTKEDHFEEQPLKTPEDHASTRSAPTAWARTKHPCISQPPPLWPPIMLTYNVPGGADKLRLHFACDPEQLVSESFLLSSVLPLQCQPLHLPFAANLLEGRRVTCPLCEFAVVLILRRKSMFEQVKFPF